MKEGDAFLRLVDFNNRMYVLYWPPHLWWMEFVKANQN